MQKGQKTEDQTYTKLDQIGWVHRWDTQQPPLPPGSLLYTVANEVEKQFSGGRQCDIVILGNRRNL
jgi:hypothetical protein